LAKEEQNLILLGTSTPNADVNKFGPSTAAVVDGQPYIIDCGPGVVRWAAAARIDEKKLNFLFVTHLHSDHTSDYPDFLLTPATGPLKYLNLMVFSP